MATFSIPKSPGIYLIKNTKNDKFYLGQTSNLRRRWIDHRCRLRGNRHDNSHLQRAWNKYGEKSFKFLVLEHCTSEQLNEREQHYLDLYALDRNCYNIALDTFSPTRGRGHGVSTKEKLSKMRLGEKNPFFGKHHTEETKQKISDAVRGENHPLYGKPLSPETRTKISEAHQGKTLSDDAKAAISLRLLGNDYHKGKKASPETRKKMSEARKGKPHSPEHRAKLAAANRRRAEENKLKKPDSESG